MSLAAHQAAVEALLSAALAPKPVYAVDKVPATRPAEYVEVLVSEIYTPTDALLLDATTNVRRYRATVWWLSRTSLNNALRMRDKSFAALRFARLTVDGEEYPPAQYEGTEDDVKPDDGWFVGSAEFAY